MDLQSQCVLSLHLVGRGAAAMPVLLKMGLLWLLTAARPRQMRKQLAEGKQVGDPLPAV